MAETEDFQYNYEKLFRFLSRKDGHGFIFAMAEDMRYIRQINESLVADLNNRKNLKAQVVFLDAKSDTPVMQQIREYASGNDALLVANLYDLVNDPENGKSVLLSLNFSREALQQLPVRTIFWVTERSLAMIGNLAQDIYSQRDLSTVHFTGNIERNIEQELPVDEDWKDYLGSEKFKDAEAKVAILKQRLADAQAGGYPKIRTATEIALPLAAEYAVLGAKDKALSLLADYDDNFDKEDLTILTGLANIYKNLHDLKEASSLLKKAIEILEEYSVNETEDQMAKDFLMDLYMELGDNFRELGEFANATHNYNKGLQYFKISHELDPHSINYKNGLAVAYGRLGGIYQSKGEPEKALDYFLKDMRLSAELSKSHPQSEDIKYALSISYLKLGEIYQLKGEIEKALDYFLKDMQLTLELTKSDPQSENFKEGLAYSYGRLGNIYQSKGEIEKALDYFLKRLDLAEQLNKSNPQSESPKRGLAASYERLGDVYRIKGETEKALGFFLKRLELAEQLTQSNPHSENLKYGLALSNGRLGDIYKSKDENEKALDFYTKATTLFEELTKSNPQSENLKSSLATSYNRLSAIYNSHSEIEKALDYVLRSLDLARQLYYSNPDSVLLANGFAASNANIGLLYIEMDQKETGKNCFLTAEKIWVELCKKTDMQEYKDNLERVRKQLLDLEQNAAPE